MPLLFSLKILIQVSIRLGSVRDKKLRSALPHNAGQRALGKPDVAKVLLGR